MVQVESARERLRAFSDKQAAHRQAGWLIAESEFFVGEAVPWSVNGHPIKTIIDRIDRLEDGKEWCVWDYKTSGKAHPPESQHLKAWKADENRMKLGELIEPTGRQKALRRWADVQLPLYAKFVQEHFKTERLPDVCLLYTSPSPRDQRGSRMPSSA